jgi:hypothetical protein
MHFASVALWIAMIIRPSYNRLMHISTVLCSTLYQGVTAWFYAGIKDHDTYTFFIAVGFVQALVAFYGGFLAIIGLEKLGSTKRKVHTMVFAFFALTLMCLTMKIGQLSDKSQAESNMKAENARQAEITDHTLLEGLTTRDGFQVNRVGIVKTALQRLPITPESKRLIDELSSIQQRLLDTAQMASSGQSNPAIVPRPSQVSSIKTALDNMGMRVTFIDLAGPDKRQDLYKDWYMGRAREMVGTTAPFGTPNLTPEQTEIIRRGYLSDLAKINAADVTAYSNVEVDILALLSEAYTALNYSDSRKAEEFAKFKVLSSPWCKQVYSPRIFVVG